jgi:hypothetical protein
MPTHHTALSLALPPLPIVIAMIVAVVLYVRVVTYFISDLYKPERVVVGFSKDVWAVIIILGSIAGMAAYLLFGRANS